MISRKDDEFEFPVADGTAKLSGRDYDFRESTPRREQPVRSEDFSGELKGEPVEYQPTETKDDAEARADCWSFQGDFICRHRDEPRVQLYVPKEETFRNPLKYIDVTRSTHTDLDVLQGKRIDDPWNVDSSKHLSDSCRGFTKFTLLKQASKRIHVVREETVRDSIDYQTRHHHRNLKAFRGTYWLQADRLMVDDKSSANALAGFSSVQMAPIQGGAASSSDVQCQSRYRMLQRMEESHNRPFLLNRHSRCEQLVLEDTPAVLSLGKLCDENGYSYA